MKSNALVQAMRLVVVILMAAVCSPKLFAQCQYPNFGSGITIDGNDGDWDLTEDFFSEMYRAGNQGGDVLSNLYFRYDCSEQIMYALVLAQTWPEDPILAEDGNEVWIKIDNNKVVSADDRPGSFRYIDETTLDVIDELGNTVTLPIARGWEASFSLEPGEYDDVVVAHNNVWDESQYESQTSQTPDLMLCIECDPVGVELQYFGATIRDSDVFVEWGVASEINHAGYNLYRATSVDGEYTRINNAIIGIQSDASVLEEKQYNYLDSDAVGTTLYYKLEDISLDGQSTWHGPVQATIASALHGAVEQPTDFDLAQNYPNPFNPTTTLAYTLPKQSEVRLEVYDVRGALVRTLVSGKQMPGAYRVTWDGRDHSGTVVMSGIYLYRMTSGEFTKTGRMTMIK